MARNLVRVEPYIEMTFKFCTNPHTDRRRLLPPLNDKRFHPEFLGNGPRVHFDKLGFNATCYCGGMRWFNLTIVSFNSRMKKMLHYTVKIFFIAIYGLAHTAGHIY